MSEGCPSDREIEALALHGEGSGSLRAHVAGCGVCRERVDEVRENQAFLEHAREELRGAIEGGADERGAARAAVTIAGFELLEEISRGGQGVVYRAVQVATRRAAAVKVLLAGSFATERQRQRFEREIEIAARLRHPGIVSVFESGEASDGSPFVAMEFVEGRPIDEVAREGFGGGDSGVRARVDRVMRLALRVADAVGHAHNAGVIHRDLKPSNVVVDGQGQARVLDFGLAREVVAGADVSVPGEFVGTPAYASPEQLAGGASGVDTRTDVYALGVLMYRMLTGRHPYPCDVGIGELVRHVTSTEATAPSKHVGRLPTDVETIVLKCLSKDPARRYPNASALAADIRDYLEGMPISARRDSAVYVLQRLAARHRVPVAVGVVLAVTVVVSSVALAVLAAELSVQRTRAGHAEQQAAARADDLQQVSDFQASMLAQVTPVEAGRMLTRDIVARYGASLDAASVAEPERTARLEAFRGAWSQMNTTDVARSFLDNVVLTPSTRAIDEQFAGQPVIEATLLQVLADRYTSMGLFDEAEGLQRRALELRREHLGDADGETLMSINNAAGLLFERGDYEGAEALYREALATRRRTLGEDHPDTIASIGNLGGLLEEVGALEEAEALDREALERNRRVFGEESKEALLALANLGSTLEAEGRYDEAEPCYRAAADTFRRTLGADDPNTITAVHNMGQFLYLMGDLEGAEACYREALGVSRRVFGAEHPSTLATAGGLCVDLIAQNRLSEAEPLLRETVELSRRALGEVHPDTLSRTHDLAVLLHAQGKLEEAAELHRAVFEASRRELGPDDPDTLDSAVHLGGVLEDMGELEEADGLISGAYRAYRLLFGEDDPETMYACAVLGSLRNAQGRHAEAVELMEGVLPLVRRQGEEADPRDLATVLMNLGVAHTALARFGEAERELEEAYAINLGVRGPEHRATVSCVEAFVKLYEAWGAADPDGGHDADADRWRGVRTDPGAGEAGEG